MLTIAITFRGVYITLAPFASESVELCAGVTPKSFRISWRPSTPRWYDGQLIDRDDIKIEEKIGKVKVNKHGVKIMLKMDGDILELLGFYNEGNIRGLARCTLLVILKRLIEEKMVKSETILSVSSPTNDPKVIQTYINMGFEQKNARIGQPIVLEEQVCKVIKTLQEWCKTCVSENRV